MRTLLPVFLCFFILGRAVPIMGNNYHAKTAPEHVGIAEEIRVFQLSYVLDASTRNIAFKYPVTMGFNEIKWKKGKGMVVGLCTYGKNFREIDVDPKYWNASTWTTKRTLIYHEMTHCLCTRGHTWNGGTYPEAESLIMEIIARVEKPFFKREPGLLEDDCPASIMYPYVVSDECATKHWKMYDNEMFEGCNPY